MVLSGWSLPHPLILSSSLSPLQCWPCPAGRLSALSPQLPRPLPPSLILSHYLAAFAALPVYFWLALFLLPHSFCLALSPLSLSLSLSLSPSRDPSRSPTCWTAGTVSSAPRSQRVHVSSLVTPCVPVLALAISFYRFPDDSSSLRLTPEYNHPLCLPHTLSVFLLNSMRNA